MHRRPLRDSPAAPPQKVRILLLLLTGLLLGAFATSCRGDAPARQPSTARNAITSVLTGAPDELPSMTNREPPFRYPAELYAKRVQGNVTLRLFVDSTGTVIPDSTRVEETSGEGALDSAAVKGSRDLRFNPARRRGSAIAVSLLYPVYFRHPEAPPLPGDTILK
jgi:TonB family protein